MQPTRAPADKQRRSVASSSTSSPTEADPITPVLDGPPSTDLPSVSRLSWEETRKALAAIPLGTLLTPEECAARGFSAYGPAREPSKFVKDVLAGEEVQAPAAQSSGAGRERGRTAASGRKRSAPSSTREELEAEQPAVPVIPQAARLAPWSSTREGWGAAHEKPVRRAKVRRAARDVAATELLPSQDADASHAVASAGPASTSQQKIAYGKAPQGHHVNLDVVVPASPAVESVTFGATSVVAGSSAAVRPPPVPARLSAASATPASCRRPPPSTPSSSPSTPSTAFSRLLDRLNHGRPPGMEANKRPGVLPPAKVATNPGRAADPYDTDRRHPVTETPAKPPTTRASLPAAASPPVQSSAGLAAASAAKSPLSAASPTPRLASRRSDDSSEISSAAAETPVRGSGAGERMDVGKEEKGVAVKEEGMRARLRPRRSIGASSAGDSSSSAQKYARDSDAGVADEDKPSSSSSDDDQLSSASSDDDDTHPPLPLPVPYYAKLLTVFRHATIRAVEAKEADLPAGSHRGRLLGRIINEQLELQPDFEQPMPVPVPGRPKVPIKQLALWASKNGGGWIKALPKLGYKIVVNSEYGSHRVRKNLRARLKASAWYRNGMDTKQWTLDLTDEEQMFWLAAFESEALTFQKV